MNIFINFSLVVTKQVYKLFRNYFQAMLMTLQGKQLKNIIFHQIQNATNTCPQFLLLINKN